jgi:hypothetical protein
MKHASLLLVFALTSASILAISGCTFAGGFAANSPTQPAAATTLYINNYDSDNLNQISAFAVSQNTTPISDANPSSFPTAINSISLPSSVYAGLMATDAAGDLYVATSADIREYAAGATGSATPIRIIPMSSTTTLTPYVSANGHVAGNIQGLAVDSAGDIYVSEYGEGVAIFDSTANGNVAPTRYILGAAQSGGGLSTIQQPQEVAVDGSGNLYVNAETTIGNVYAVLVFGPNANGNVAPIRSLSVNALQLAVDPSGNIYMYPYDDTANSNPFAIAVFPAGASGSATPIRIIDSPAYDTEGLAADSAGNLFEDYGGGNEFNAMLGPPIIEQFSPTSSGTTMPVAEYRGGVIGVSRLSIAIH